MSLVPTATPLVVTPSVAPLNTSLGSSRTSTTVATAGQSSSQTANELILTAQSPVSKNRLINRITPNSPFGSRTRSAPQSPLLSPYTEPRLRVRNSEKSRTVPTSIRADILMVLSEAAYAGDIDAQFNLGMSYSFGKGVEQNFEKALSWFLKCANQGDSKAQYYVGVMFLNGHGTQIDQIKAAEWLKKSANQGDADAQCDLGMLYLQGCGVEINESVAISYFQKAAEQGNADAQFNLAVLYETGEGINEDATQASFWYQKAALQGDRDAQRALAKAYSLGLGVIQDTKLATYWVLRSELDTGDSIWIAQENFDLISFFPEVLKEFPEFGNIKKMKFQEGYLSYENFIALSKVIRVNNSLELLDLTGISLNNSEGLAVIQSLKENTTLTDIFFDISNLDKNIVSEIQHALSQNIAIADAKKYVQNHTLILADPLLYNDVKSSLDQLIIYSLKSGKSLGVTKHAIDKFLTNSNQSRLDKNF